jgi:phosphate-selective porin OprO/OprP
VPPGKAGIEHVLIKAWIAMNRFPPQTLLAWSTAVGLLLAATLASAAQQIAPGPTVAGHGAEPQPSDSEYQQLVNRLNAAETRIDQLERSAVEGSGDSTAGPDASPPQVNPPSATSSNTEDRIAALENAAADSKKPKYPLIKLTGFFHLDAGDFSQDPTNKATLGDIQNGVGFRRARLAGAGNLTEFNPYYLEMDFANAGRPSFFDVWGEQQQLPFLGNVRIGNFRIPTSMDSWNSVRQLWFLERSLPFQAFDPFRRVGAMAYDKSDDEMWTWAYGIYRTGGFGNAPIGDSRFATDIGDNGGVSTAGRMTHLLYYDEAAEGRYLLHVGGHANYSQNTGSTTNVPFYEARSIPEFFVGDPAGGGLTAAGTPFFLDTGRLASSQFFYYGLQLAWQYGPTHFQAEYLATNVDQAGNPNLYYDGAYAQVGYFLTGENRTYNRTYGVFDNLIPYEDFFGIGRRAGICGWGAWEVVGRWSYLDLSDPNAVPIVAAAGPPAVPNPGYLDESTLGLNWYWNQYMRMQFGWQHCFLNNVAGNSDCDIYSGRFQIQF